MWVYGSAAVVIENDLVSKAADIQNGAVQRKDGPLELWFFAHRRTNLLKEG